jgi:hypothetical protein
MMSLVLHDVVLPSRLGAVVLASFIDPTRRSRLCAGLAGGRGWSV